MRPSLAPTRRKALGIVRRGPHEVVWTPAYMGFGNLLYLALWCDQDQVNRRFLRTAKLEPWLDTFPALRPLSVAPGAVKFRDIRRSAVSHSYGRFGQDFTERHLSDFIRRRLLDVFTPTLTESIVVNIRRGDYYHDRSVRGYFAIDLNAYLREALPRMLDQRPATEIRVVSDGIDWCRDRMTWIETELGVEVLYSAQTDGPLADLTAVATTRRLLLTNSTFSYWAGYIHDVLYPGSEQDVWAPRFFSRWQPDYSAWQLNPRWSVIDDIPGGWDS